jgi:hypothetical protein
MSERTLAIVLEAQVHAAQEFARGLFAELSDDEYFWEPVPGCWSVRRNDGSTPPPELPGVLGVPEGQAKPNLRPWYCEHGWVWKGPASAGWAEFDGRPPVTTIAWLMTHTSSCQIGYHQDVFDSGDRRMDDLVPTSAAEAVALFEEGAGLLLGSLRSLSDTELVEPPATPKQLEDRQSPFGLRGEPLWRLYSAIGVAHLTHHAAEVGRMRDLFASRGES